MSNRAQIDGEFPFIGAIAKTYRSTVGEDDWRKNDAVEWPDGRPRDR